MNRTNCSAAVTLSQQNVGGTVPVDEIRNETATAIKRIAGYANAVTALLETFDMVPTTGQGDILAVASSIANDVAHDLASLLGGVQ